jgi:cyclic pyranopterin phosphate synthase
MKLAKNELRISITAACNMKCVYCHNEGNTKMAMLTKEQIREIVEASKDFGLKKIRITGGEPLVSPYVEEICQMLTEEYGISVEMNTNGIEIEKLLRMIKKGWLKKVVIGMDYFDKEISKNSPVGKSSATIKNNILEIKKTGCEVRIATVYNDDDENTENIVRWAVDNDIGVRVLEIVREETDEEYSKRYMNLQKKIAADIELDWHIDSVMEELNGAKDGKVLVKFYHSLCRLGLCNICKKVPFRITSSGIARPCILTSSTDVDLFDGNIRENITKVMKQETNINKIRNSEVIIK